MSSLFFTAFFLLAELLLCTVSFAGEIVLTASAVKKKSITDNVSIHSAKLDYEIGREDLRAARSIYDPVIKAGVSHVQDKSSRSTAFFGTETNTTDFSLTLSQKNPLGSEFEFGFVNQRESTDFALATFNPTYETALEFNLRQPVLSNWLGYADRKGIQVVKKKVEALDYSTKAFVSSQVLENLKSWWNYYWAHYDKLFARDALDNAHQLLRANRAKKQMGLIEDPDLAAFEANVNLQEARYLTAAERLIQAREDLRNRLGLSPADQIIPGKENFTKASLPPLSDALALGFQSRPDFLAVKEELTAANIALKMDNNKRWPQMDLVASLRLNGLEGAYGNAASDLADGHPQWMVGAEFLVPLPNRANRAQARISKLKRAQALLALKKKEMDLVQEITTALHGADFHYRRMVASRNVRYHQFKKMEGEMRRFAQGRSDSDTLIRFQNDYVDARQMALKAEVDYRTALHFLGYAQGLLLSE